MYSYNIPKTSIKERVLALKYLIFDNPLNYLQSILSTHETFFLYDGNSYKYARFLKNTVYSSERSIEIPVVMNYIKTCKGDILEVGNVLNQYYKFNHDVIDKYESSEGVINTDIVDFVPEKLYDLIVSISTLEHIGHDEEVKDKTKIFKALDKMFYATKKGGNIIVTVPLGHNLSLDSYLREGVINAPEMHLMRRYSKNNEWIEEPIDLLKTEKFVYGSPFPFGNWILIMHWTSASIPK